MKKVMRPRYYCDFCKKVGGSAGHMRTHEANCTANPGRGCRMCVAQKMPQAPLDALLAAAGNIDALREAAHGCPACMLAAIRQAKWPVKVVDDEIVGRLEWLDIPEHAHNWKFKDEAVAFWDRVHKSEARSEYYGY